MKDKFHRLIGFIAILTAFLCVAGCSVSESSASEKTIIETAAQNTPEESEPKDNEDPLENIWKDADYFEINGVSITRRCTPTEVKNREDCKLTLANKGETVKELANAFGRKYWLRYGFFNLLNSGTEQLVLFEYSGGAHCCYEYVIYDLSPKLRMIYDSSEFGGTVGDSLIPLDIDQDGTFEFYQDVMSFDYIGRFGHASAAFPPAIFAYDSNTQKYVLANKRFPAYVLERLAEYLRQLEAWRVGNEKDGTPVADSEMDEIKVRATFLYWVYAGKRNEAWDYFDKNYKTPTGDQYQDQFREKFRTDFKSIFAEDPTYISIYGK